MTLKTAQPTLSLKIASKRLEPFFCCRYVFNFAIIFRLVGGFFDMAFKTTHNKDESLPQFMKSPQLIFSHKNS